MIPVAGVANSFDLIQELDVCSIYFAEYVETPILNELDRDETGSFLLDQ